jgi:ATP-dependent Clp protease protease subunit
VVRGPGGEHGGQQHGRVLIHQPWSPGIAGQATDLKIQAEEILRTRASLNEILAHHTGQPLERIERDTDRDYYMNADEAKEYGIVDLVAIRQPDEGEAS